MYSHTKIGCPLSEKLANLFTSLGKFSFKEITRLCKKKKKKNPSRVHRTVLPQITTAPKWFALLWCLNHAQAVAESKYLHQIESQNSVYKTIGETETTRENKQDFLLWLCYFAFYSSIFSGSVIVLSPYSWFAFAFLQNSSHKNLNKSDFHVEGCDWSGPRYFNHSHLVCFCPIPPKSQWLYSFLERALIRQRSGEKWPGSLFEKEYFMLSLTQKVPAQFKKYFPSKAEGCQTCGPWAKTGPLDLQT